MLTIGITGPTGSGKTTFLARLAAHGGTVIDCDALYAQLLEQDAALRQALTAGFGEVFLPDGTLNRKALAAQVFSDGQALARLNEIAFFHVGRAVREQLNRAQAQGCTLAGIDAINLFESGLHESCSTTVAVVAPEQLRLARICQRDRLTQQQALARMHAQKSAQFYTQRCRYTLENSGESRETFSARAEQLLEIIMKENAS